MFGFSPFSAAPFSASGSIRASVTLTGVSATADIGIPTIYAERFQVVSPTGTGASGAVGVPEIYLPAVAQVIGVQAVGGIGGVSVSSWVTINDNQTPNWVPVNDTQADTWTLVNDGNTVVWTEIAT